MATGSFTPLLGHHVRLGWPGTLPSLLELSTQALRLLKPHMRSLTGKCPWRIELEGHLSEEWSQEAAQLGTATL